MARISVEDCLKKVSNRFALVLLASARTKQLYKGSKPRVQSDNKEIVLALREIAAGKVTTARALEDGRSLPGTVPKELKEA
ncbi:MAG TPA: DNA-directed RNA polymerase subunit omega [Thermodesulfobacteriota bacterium]|jgi:DNA-directed RNA polymerase subunit omega|nr:DNA-directed RNA polymerase subunit omega [Thermodesulfobacteriota bacterium]